MPELNPEGAWCMLLTGMPNAGKSTIAYHLVQKKLRNVLIIDGDRHREMQFLGKELGFTKEDIMANTWHVIKMAKFAQEQNINIIISQITPYREQKELMRQELGNYIEVFLECPIEERSKRPNFTNSKLVYEIGSPDLIIDTNKLSIEECSNLILQKLNYKV